MRLIYFHGTPENVLRVTLLRSHAKLHQGFISLIFKVFSMILLELISPCIAWLLLAIIFACLELAVPGMFACIAFALGATVAAVSSYFCSDITLQATIFFATSILTFVVIRLQLKEAKLSEVEIRHTLTNFQALIGQEAIVTSEVLPHQTGLAHVGGEIWTCRNVETTILEQGTRTLILRVQESTLILKEK